MAKFSERDLSFARSQILQSPNDEAQQRQIAEQYGLLGELDALVRQSRILTLPQANRDNHASNVTAARAQANRQVVDRHNLIKDLRYNKG